MLRSSHAKLSFPALHKNLLTWERWPLSRIMNLPRAPSATFTCSTRFLLFYMVRVYMALYYVVLYCSPCHYRHFRVCLCQLSMACRSDCRHCHRSRRAWSRATRNGARSVSIARITHSSDTPFARRLRRNTQTGARASCTLQRRRNNNNNCNHRIRVPPLHRVCVSFAARRRRRRRRCVVGHAGLTSTRTHPAQP